MALKRVSSAAGNLHYTYPPVVLSPMQQPCLDTVVSINPSFRTRLLGPQIKEPDFTHLYITSCISIVFVCLTIFWLWEHGFVASWTSQSLAGVTVFFLALNAILGYRLKIKLKKFKETEYSDYVSRLSQVATHEKLRPIWIERNPRAV